MANPEKPEASGGATLPVPPEVPAPSAAHGSPAGSVTPAAVAAAALALANAAAAMAEVVAALGAPPPPATLRSGKLHFELAEEIYFTNRIQLANAIAEQIWREQQLVSNRMGWNMSAQTFLAAIYVFAGSQLHGGEELLVQFVLSMFGFVVALFTMFGVLAAQAQSTRLKRHWIREFHPDPDGLGKAKDGEIEPGSCKIQQGAYPQPFSQAQGSWRGRFASRYLCVALMMMWGLMLGISVGLHWDLIETCLPFGLAQVQPPAQTTPQSPSPQALTTLQAPTAPSAPATPQAHKKVPRKPNSTNG